VTVQSSILPTFSKPGASFDVDEAKVCRSPLAGVVARLHANPGQPVQTNELLLVLDAMKMEIKITAQSAGTIKSISVAPGEAVKPNQILVYFD
jgi:methylmalonyl-CoA carboxyltransferase small subunit